MDPSDNAEIAVLQVQVAALQKTVEAMDEKLTSLQTTMDTLKGGKNVMVAIWMFLGALLASVIGGISQGAISWHS